MAGSKYWLPENISTHGAEIDRLINWIHVFMILLFVGWGIFFVYCLIKFRQRPAQPAQYGDIKAKVSKFSEGLVVVVEVILLFVLSVPVWGQLKTQFPPRDAPREEIRVVAQQFAWNVHYPGADGLFGPTSPKLVDEQTNPIGLDRSDPKGKDDVWLVNDLRIPVKRPVIIRLSSKDVIHGFSLPTMRIKQDAVPGMSIPIWMEAERAGESDIACAQLCGLGHFRMRGSFKAVPAGEYESWLKQQAASIIEEEDWGNE